MWLMLTEDKKREIVGKICIYKFMKTGSKEEKGPSHAFPNGYHNMSPHQAEVPV